MRALLLILLLSGCVAQDNWQPTYLGTESRRFTVPVYPMVTPTRLEPMAPAPRPAMYPQTPYAPGVFRP